MELENNEVDLTDENLNVSLSEEEIQKIESASLEELFESLESIEETAEAVEAEEVPVEDLEPAMESLMGMMDEIRHSGGISRSDAATLMGMTSSMEGFQDTFRNLPLVSFTEVPSKVNYDASMESVVGDVVKKIIEAIKRAIRWIKEKIVKAWRWISGSEKTVKQAEAAVDKVAKEVKDVPPTTKAELTRVAAAVKVAKTEAPSKAEFDKLMEDPTKSLKIGKGGELTKIELKVVEAVAAAPEAAPEAVVEDIVDQFRAHMEGAVDDLMIEVATTSIESDDLDRVNRILDATIRFNRQKDWRAFEKEIGSTLAKRIDDSPLSENSDLRKLANDDPYLARHRVDGVTHLLDVFGRTVREKRGSKEKIKKTDFYKTLNSLDNYVVKTSIKNKNARTAITAKIKSILREAERNGDALWTEVEKLNRRYSESTPESRREATRIQNSVSVYSDFLETVANIGGRLQGEYSATAGRIAKQVWIYRASTHYTSNSKK